LFAGALLPFRHVRWTHTLMAGVDLERDEAACTGVCRAAARRDLRSLRGGWSFDSRRIFPYSISTEEGGLLQAGVESAHGGGPLRERAASAVLDARLFQRVVTRHTVLALRMAVATSVGDAGARRLFSAAGAGTAAPPFDFGRDAIGLLRGFQPEDVVGTHAAVVNADLRVPLARIERGAGTWPFFLRSLHAAAFFDAGSAWDRDVRRADLRRSAGGELSLDAVVLYSVRVTIAAGAARTHDPVAGSDRTAVFARIGYAF